MQLQFNAPQGAQTLRFIRFKNGEVMAEIERGGTRKQNLTVQPSGAVLYSGLSGEDSPTVGAKNPFMFLDMVFTYPFQALQAAYPSGPQSVPEQPLEAKIVLEGKHPATIKAHQVSNSRVSFHLAVRGNANWEVDGVWDGNLPEPLPDDLPVGTWRHSHTAVFGTLRDAREFSK